MISKRIIPQSNFNHWLGFLITLLILGSAYYYIFFVFGERINQGVLDFNTTFFEKEIKTFNDAIGAFQLIQAFTFLLQTIFVKFSFMYAVLISWFQLACRIGFIDKPRRKEKTVQPKLTEKNIAERLTDLIWSILFVPLFAGAVLWVLIIAYLILKTVGKFVG